MRTSHLLVLASLCAVAAAAVALGASSLPALAAGDVSVGAFKAIELRDGGEVVIHQGAQQRVTLVEGDPRFTHFTVDSEGRLLIETSCNNDCPHHYKLRVDVVTPHVIGVAVAQGGAIRAEGNFAPQSDIAAAVHQGGSVDVRAIHATNVAAAVHQGGSVTVTADHNLTAAVHEGGQVTFWGHPSNITKAVSQGGSVRGAEMADSDAHSHTVSVVRNNGHTDVNVDGDDEDTDNDDDSDNDEDDGDDQ